MSQSREPLGAAEYSAIVDAIVADLVAAVRSSRFSPFERDGLRLDFTACGHCKAFHPDHIAVVLRGLGEDYLADVAGRPVHLLVMHPASISL